MMMIAYRDGMLASPPRYWGLCFTAEEPGVVVDMAKSGSPPVVALETSRDGVTWKTFDSEGGSTPVLLPSIGDKVLFRAGSGGNSAMASSTADYHNFTVSGTCSASGNIMSLLDANDSENVTLSTENTFTKLFYNCGSLTSAPDLPATTLTDSCYRQMFWNCYLLESAPSLPALGMAPSCYRQMFRNCTALVDAPDLPSTSLATECYRQMFSGCTSLQNGPTALPATSLAIGCYRQMFNNCSQLHNVMPTLPATVAEEDCYNQMFSGCSSLATPPSILLTSVAISCCSQMFRYCDAIATAPTLYATDITGVAANMDCYDRMFYGCGNLRSIEVRFTSFDDFNTATWLDGVQTYGTFRCPIALGTGANILRGASYCPYAWTVENID